MRSHTAAIIKTLYNRHLNKVVSISKDNTIRIWQYVVESHAVFPFRLQEQYEFMITGEEMVDLASASEGKHEDLVNIVIGGDSGKLRLIDL